MRPEGALTAAPVADDLDHALVIAVISIVAEARPRADGRIVAHMAAEACANLPAGAMAADEVAAVLMASMDAPSSNT